MATPEAGVQSHEANGPYWKLQPLPLTAAQVANEFWAPRLDMLREVTLPEQFAQCERSGRIDNFRRAAGKIGGEFQGLYFNDSDVYKWLEAASYALAGRRDPQLEHTVDAVIAELAAAQQPDGYLNTYFALERAGERWSDLLHKHELYCAGHLLQAAVAHQRATGKRTLLDVAIRYADLICRTFGPNARHATDGHEEIELALVELYRTTGNRTYLDRARFFLDQRGQRPPVLNGTAYLQDHLPVREQREVVGHAVRAAYLACGIVDVYAETGEDALAQAAERLWESAFERKAYITGGLGARHEGEAFGADYELPNERAYAETCAAIGGFLWSWRLLLTTGEARYADWMETALYNGILSGLSLDGTQYFYVNPLADRGDHRRQSWFSCACCPPNLARLLMSLPGYLASASADGLWLHLYAAGSVQATLPDGDTLALEIATRYPW
ncbi:MAG TPA: beta-L-arabinofuranosidase domain-containing protein, partial [Chloroflexota bacterium]|nr:beta-L-arabinofuranosidase domain-containing protein [Chloroflexota bacterium]